MEWVETTGRTVEEAKDAALDQLGVDDADAEFVVVSEPRAGLFGRMRGEARVRARVRPTSPRPKRNRARRGGQEQRRGSTRRDGERAGATTSVVEPGSSERGDVLDGEAPSSNGSAGPTAKRRNRRRGSGGAPGRPSAAPAKQNGAGSASSGGGRPQKAGGPDGGDRPRRSETPKEEIVGEVLTLEEQGESARAFIEGLVREFGLEATVALRLLDEETAEVAVDGSELGILVGPGGSTLGALQELARTVVQRRTGGHSERILVDVAGYRAKRSAALQRFTRQVAEEVLASGTEQALEPMLAPDRKVVHDTVGEIDGVATRSDGEEPRRFVVISPVGAAGPSLSAHTDDEDEDEDDDDEGDGD